MTLMDALRLYNQKFSYLLLAALLFGAMAGPASAADDPWANLSELRWQIKGLAFEPNGWVAIAYEYYDRVQNGPPEKTVATVTGYFNGQTGRLLKSSVICRHKISSPVLSTDRNAMAFGIYASEDIRGTSNSSSQSPAIISLPEGKFGAVVISERGPPTIIADNAERMLTPVYLSTEALWMTVRGSPNQMLVRYDLRKKQSSASDLGAFAASDFEKVGENTFIFTGAGPSNVELIAGLASTTGIEPIELRFRFLIYEFDAANSKLALHPISAYLAQDRGFGPIVDFGTAYRTRGGTIYVVASHAKTSLPDVGLYQYQNGTLDPVHKFTSGIGKWAVSDDGERIAFAHRVRIAPTDRVEVVDRLSFLQLKTHWYSTFDLGEDQYLRLAKEACPH
jgi:hypothetical protein